LNIYRKGTRDTEG